MRVTGIPPQPLFRTDPSTELSSRPVAAQNTPVLPLDRMDHGVVGPGPVRTDPTPAPQPVPDDSDPMTHINYFASDALAGRDSPSPGLDLAAQYIQQHLQQYGFQGINPSDSQSPYYQTFNMWNFANADLAEKDPGTEPQQFGHQLFEHGFYVDDTLSQSDLQTLRQRYVSARMQQGLAPAEALSEAAKLDSVDALKQMAKPSGQVQNVVGMLPGSGPHKDEVIVLSAHYDHLGKTSRGMYPGADDNASGSAALLAALPELQQLSKDGKLDRSVVIVWTAAEEKGLVGSKYFVDHPLPGVNPSTIKGVINMDMVGRGGNENVSVIDLPGKGQKTNPLHDVVDQANNELENPFDHVNHDINEYYDRQDGAMFAQKGENVLFLFEGLSNPEGGGDLNPDYHRPTDTPDKILTDNGGLKPARIRDLMVNVIQHIANPQPTVGWSE